jgi:hypothetical protein
VRWPFRRLRAGFGPTSGPYGELRRGCFVPRKSAAQRLSTHNVSQPIHPLTPRALDGCLYPRPPARAAPAAVTYATQFCHDLILLLLGNKSRLLLLLTWADSRSVRNHPFRVRPSLRHAPCRTSQRDPASGAASGQVSPRSRIRRLARISTGRLTRPPASHCRTASWLTPRLRPSAARDCPASSCRRSHAVNSGREGRYIQGASVMQTVCSNTTKDAT